MHACANIQSGDAAVRTIRLLVAANASVNHVCAAELDALALSAKSNSLEAIEELFQQGAVMRPDSLAFALLLPNIGSASASLGLLLAKCPRVETCVTARIETPLLLAARQATPQLVEQLLAYPDIEGCLNLPDVDGATPLHAWLFHGPVAVTVTNKFLEKGANCCAVDKDGATPLMTLLSSRKTLSGKLSLVETLLRSPDFRKSINIADKWGITPLHMACYHFSAPMCRLLLDAGADLCAVDLQGNTPLHAALMQLSLVYSSETDLYNFNTKSSSGNVEFRSEWSSSLTADSVLGELQGHALFKQCVHTRNRDGLTPVHLAANAAECSSKTMQTLLGALESRDVLLLVKPTGLRGNSPLHLAAVRGNEHVVEEILKYDPSLAQCVNHFGETPLLCCTKLLTARFQQREHAVHMHYMQNKPVISAEPRANCSIPYWREPYAFEREGSIPTRKVVACFNQIRGHTSVESLGRIDVFGFCAARVFLEGHVREAVVSPWELLTPDLCQRFRLPGTGQTLLHLFARYPFVETAHSPQAFLDRFKECGVNFDVADSHGRTAFLEAARIGSFEGFSLLLNAVPSSGLDINASDAEGNTALHHLVCRAHPPPLESLLAFPGVDVNVRNKRGETPLYLAVAYSQIGFVHRLLHAGALVDAACLQLAEQIAASCGIPTPQVMDVLVRLFEAPHPPFSLGILTSAQRDVFEKLLSGALPRCSPAQMVEHDRLVHRLLREIPSAMTIIPGVDDAPLLNAAFDFPAPMMRTGLSSTSNRPPAVAPVFIPRDIPSLQAYIGAVTRYILPFHHTEGAAAIVFADHFGDAAPGSERGPPQPQQFAFVME